MIVQLYLGGKTLPPQQRRKGNQFHLLGSKVQVQTELVRDESLVIHQFKRQVGKSQGGDFKRLFLKRIREMKAATGILEGRNLMIGTQDNTKAVTGEWEDQEAAQEVQEETKVVTGTQVLLELCQEEVRGMKEFVAEQIIDMNRTVRLEQEADLQEMLLVAHHLPQQGRGSQETKWKTIPRNWQ